MGASRIRRTRTDQQRIEHLAEADANGARIVELDVAVRPWLAGTIASAVQTQVLDDRSPADAMERGGILPDLEHRGSEKHKPDPE